MKQVKQWLKRGLATVLTICITAGVIGQLQPATVAEAAASVNVFTLKDAGIPDGPYGGGMTKGQYTRTGKTNLDGTILNTNIRFDGDGAQLRFGGAQTGGWYGLQLSTNFDADKNSLYLYDAALGMVASSNKGWIKTFSPGNIEGITSLVGEEYNLKISIQFVNADSGSTKNDLKLGFYFKDQLYNNEYVVFNNYLDQTNGFSGDYMGVYSASAEATVTVSAPTSTTPQTGLKQITATDFGLVGTHSESTKGNYSEITNFDGTMFEADVTITATNGQSNIRLGGALPGGYYGLQFGTNFDASSQNLYIYDAASAWGGATNAGWMKTFTPDIAGTTLIGQPFHFKMSTRFIDHNGDGFQNDVEIGVWFEGKLYNNEYIIFENYVDYADGMKGNYIGVFPGSGQITLGDPTIEPETEPTEGYTKMTFWHYNLDNGTAAAGGTRGQNDTIDTFNKKAFTANLKFSTDSSLSFGGWDNADGSGPWLGIRLACDPNGHINLQDNFGTGQTATPLYGKDVRGDFIKVSMYFDYVGDDSADLQIKYYIDNILYGTYVYEGKASQIGKYLTLYGTIEWESIGKKPIAGDSEASYDLAKGNYLVIGHNAVVKDAEGQVIESMTTGSEISIPGDYTIESESGVQTNRQVVILYQIGDVDLDGKVGEPSDLVALGNIIDGQEVTKAAKKGADLDHDGSVGESDLALMKKLANGKITIEKIKEKYYPAALTYDFLSEDGENGDEVMPISGFFGPMRRSETLDYLNDTVFDAIQASGVNLINYAWRDWAEDTTGTDIKAALELAQSKGIGYYVNDARLNTKIDLQGTITENAEPLSTKEVAEYLSDYSYYQSALGIHVKDEPYNDSFLWTDDTAKSSQLKYYQDIANKLNSFTNTNGYITMHPEDAKYSQFNLTTYSAFWDTYIEKTNPQVLAVDDYPFNDKSEEGVTNAKGYFTTLSVVRNKAVFNNLPFWAHVQAGGDYDGDGTTETDLIASETETYWNVNTVLAFGAKGIAWFPLIQPEYMAATDTKADTNGLLDKDGDTTVFYTWATNANNQIKAIDEVLMKASSNGVVAAGGTSSYAYTQTEGLTGMLKKTNNVYTDKLADVTADNGEYGALVGCFDYKDTESYYVVNYDVTAGATQKIKLTFDKKYNYYYVADGEKSAMQVGDSCELTIPSGKGVLVVLDSEWEPESWEVEGNWDANEVTHMDFKHPTNGTYLANQKYTLESGSTLVAYGQYNPRVTNGTAPNSLNGMEFTTKMLLHGDAHIRYGGLQTGGGWYGLAVRLDPSDTNSLAIIWEDEGSYRKIGESIQPNQEKYGVTSFADTTFTLKVVLTKSGEDLLAQVYINDVWANDYTFTGNASRLGNYMGIVVSDTGSYVILDTPEPKGFTAITTSDIGVGDTYAPADVSGVYKGESMDKVLFTANLDFKGDTDNCICFGAPENSKWNAIRFTVNENGKLVVNSGAALKKDGSNYASSDWQYTIPTEGEFHLQVTTEYVDFDRDGYKDDVRLGVWIDGVMQNGYIHFVDFVPSMGNAMLFHAKLIGYINHRNQYEPFVVKAAPLTKKMADAAYDLTESKSYTIPGTETTLSEPGDYKVNYTQSGTKYSGNVSLYYEGDATMDGVLDARDLVRMKKGLKELTPADVTGYRFNGVDTLENTAITFKTAFTYNNLGGSCVRFGRGDEEYFSSHGISMGHHVNGNEPCLVIYWIDANGSPSNYQFIYEKDVNHIVDRLHTDELIIRLETTCVDNNILIGLYINNQYVGQVSFNGKKQELGNSWNAINLEVDSISQKVYTESADMDNNGSVNANDTMQLRKVLTGAEVEKDTVVGVLSDTHFSGAGNDAAEQERFEKALNYYKANNADVIIMNADLIDRSEKEAYQVFTDIVKRVYGDAPEGARPEFVMTGDNHEWFDSWFWLDSADKPEALPLSTTMKRFYDYMSAFDTQLEMDENGLLSSTSRVVNGYTFIAFNADKLLGGAANYSNESLEWLDNELEKATAANPDKPIFVAIHQPPKNTVSASDGSDGVDGYNDVLKKYPQVVLFTGHTHASIQRERSIYQKDYTVVNSGTLSYVGTYLEGLTFANKGDTNTNPKLKEMAEALLVRISGKSVDIERCDFLGDAVQKNRNNWVLEDATNKEAFVYTDTWFASHTTAPVFANGAASEATVTWSEDGAILSFPAATHEGEFVYYYEITVDGTTKNYLTDYWSGIQNMATTCEYLLEGVSSYSTISIRAVDEYGNKSEVITISK